MIIMRTTLRMIDDHVYHNEVEDDDDNDNEHDDDRRVILMRAASYQSSQARFPRTCQLTRQPGVT